MNESCVINAALAEGTDIAIAMFPMATDLLILVLTAVTIPIASSA